MTNPNTMRPTLGVAIMAAIGAACFSPEGEEKRLAAERVREARVLRAAGAQPLHAVRPPPAVPAASTRDGTSVARAAP
jgi:hypothetical protein